jgi:hypothetical protein
MLEKQAPQPIALREDYIATFQGFKPGQKVLLDLTARYHDRSIYVAGGIEGQRETERRAARKEVVEFILMMISKKGGDNNAD